MDALNGKRLVILGMARQGTSLARFAVGAGAFVTLSDMRSPAACRWSIWARCSITSS